MVSCWGFGQGERLPGLVGHLDLDGGWRRTLLGKRRHGCFIACIDVGRPYDQWGTTVFE